MGFQIQDGAGTSKKASVDGTNRLSTRSVTETFFEEQAFDGSAYFIGTPLVNLNSTTASAIIYIKNNEERDLIFDNFFLIAESTTGGSPSVFRTIWYKNPTSMSPAFDTSPLNQNFGSSKELSATTHYGTQSATFTGGTIVAQLSFPIGQFNDIPSKLILPKGSSFGLSIQAPAGNTSMNVQFGARTALRSDVF